MTLDQVHAVNAESEQFEQEFVLPVAGMSCANCAATIEKNIGKLPGISLAQVNFAGETLRIRMNQKLTNVIKIKKKIEALGYKLPVITRNFSLPEDGGDTPGDEHVIERQLLSAELSEIAGYNIDLLHRVLSIDIPASGVSLESIKKKLLSFNIKILDSKDFSLTSFEQKEEKRQAQQLFAALVFTLPLFALSMGRDFGLVTLNLGTHEKTIINLVLLLLATPVQFWIGADFYKGAYGSLRAGAANMDTLVALGSSASYFYSLSVAFTPSHHVYFETSAMIITLIKIGKFLETKAKRKTGEFLKSIARLIPKEALIRRDGTEYTLSVGDIRVGDTLILRPGEKVTLDSHITRGTGSMNFSVITGESLPIDVKPGARLYAGVLNIDGHIEAQVDRSEEDSLLGQIIKMVSIAQASKAPIQKFADEISKYFVPIVIVLAILTFAIWAYVDSYSYAIIRMVAVLVVACPCALGLATPTAIAVAMGVGAKAGLLFKNSEALQKLSQIDTLCFDKTGTVTTGKLELSDLTSLIPDNKDSLLLALAQIEKGSEHPIAKAIVEKAKSLGLEGDSNAVTDFKAFPGGGVKASIGDRKYSIGNPEFISQNNILADPKILEMVDTLQSEGKTAIMVSEGSQILGIAAFADRVRDDAASALAPLKTFLTLYLITGDNLKAAQKVADQLGIKNYFAELKPLDKLKQIRILQNEGRRVAMVGDGINDAPALARADIGIAMGGGTDVALSSSDITLVKNDLSRLNQAFVLSKYTLSIIKQNFLWAFIYNITLIPIAAGVFFSGPVCLPSWLREFHPILAAAAMSFSSISVVLNSLRINRLFRNNSPISDNQYIA